MTTQTTNRGGLRVAALTTCTLLASLGTVLAPQAAEAGTYPGATGKIVFTSDRDARGTTEIYTMNPDGTEATRLTNDTTAEFFPTWNAAGTKIAFERWQPAADGGAHGIYVMNPDGSGQTLVSANDSKPSWSPDGTRLAVVGSNGIDVINADGSGRTHLTDAGFDPEWSPNGDKIAFGSSRDGGLPQLYVMNADGSNQTRITSNDDWDQEPTWSPDGTKIAIHRMLTPDLYDVLVTMNADGTGETTLVGPPLDAWAPSWSPDGTRIGFTSHPDGDGTAALYAVTVDGHGLQRLSAPALKFYNDRTPDYQPVPNQAPTVTPTSGTVQYSDPISPLTVTGTDPDGDPVTLGASGLPASLGFTDNGSGSGTVSGTATADPGSYTVTYSANDAHNPATTATGTIVVTREDCTLAYTGDLYVAAGASTNLKAHFDESDATKGDPSGHSVVFDLVDSAGNTYPQHPASTTNSAGDAVASLALPSGVYTVGAHFDGDTRYDTCRATEVVVTVASAKSKVSGAGWIALPTRTSFGFNVVPQGNGLWAGPVQVRIPASQGQFDGTSVSSVTFSGTHRATLSGAGSYNHVAGYGYTVSVVDNGTSTKTPDQISLVITSPSGQTVYSTGLQALRGGNLVVVR
jgi:hypothetical protein